MQEDRIKIENIENAIITNGLNEKLGAEIKVFKGLLNIRSYKSLLEYLIHYIVYENKVIKDEETLSYFSWLLKFKQNDHGIFEVYELNKENKEFVLGADYALNILEQQLAFCRRHEVFPLFPNFGQKIAISKGVMEGDPIQGVRYKAPDHMTGWYITTNRYNGNVDTLKIIYFYDLIFERPNLINYLCLPCGYRFEEYLGKFEVWFDKEVANATD